jgi:predicted phage terminase large subunit-like protein
VLRWIRRRWPNKFIEYCFADPHGGSLKQGRVHKQLQAFLKRNRHGLVELPRDHGKSTQVCARIVWELGRRPGLRVRIVCATEALAAERGRFIRRAIEANPRVREVFPNLVPARPWSDTRLTVARPAEVIGPSLTAVGVGCGSTGARADLLVCDDIVDVKSLASRAERDRVKDHFRNDLMNLLEPDGRFWGLCTPWHRDDLNAELKRGGTYPLFRRAITEDLDPIWPERWPRDALATRRDEIGVAAFARGYRLVPLADDETAIKANQVQYWEEPEKDEANLVILSVDPALSTNSRADRSALVVLAQFGEPGGPKEVRCLAASAHRVAAPELVTQIATMDHTWNPGIILFETNGAFKGIKDLMTRHAPFGPKVHDVSQSRDKTSRVAAFSVQVANGSFRLKGNRGQVDPTQQELFDEMTTFPVGEHDDLVDAAATGTAFLLGATEPRVFTLGGGEP